MSHLSGASSSSSSSSSSLSLASSVRARSPPASSASAEEDASMRRVRVRGADSADASSSVAATVLHPPPLIARLHRHELESVLGFCSLQELHSAAQVSREWLGAVSTMRPVGTTLYLSSSQQEQAFTSLLIHHVSKLGLHKMPTAELQRLPALRCLDLSCRSSPLACLLATPLRLPTQLLQLRVEIPENIDVTNSLLQAIGQVAELEECEIDIGQLDMAAVSLAPLRPLTHLHSLRFSCQCFDYIGRSCDHWLSVTDESLATLASLPALRTLATGRMSGQSLARLLQLPGSHAHQLEAFDGLTMDAQTCALLPRLGSLTRLSAWGEQQSVAGAHTDFSVLSHLSSKLRSLEFMLVGSRAVTDALLSALHPLSKLIDLTLRFAVRDGVSAVALHRMMEGMVSLQTLSMEAVNLGSLQFLEQTHLQRSLGSLSLFDVSIPANSLTSLLPLRALESLELSFCVRLDAFSVALLRPPSAIIPSLLDFRYDPLQED